MTEKNNKSNFIRIYARKLLFAGFEPKKLCMSLDSWYNWTDALNEIWAVDTFLFDYKSFFFNSQAFLKEAKNWILSLSWIRHPKGSK